LARDTEQRGNGVQPRATIRLAARHEMRGVDNPVEIGGQEGAEGDAAMECAR
jgi:hypothetical protein